MKLQQCNEEELRTQNFRQLASRKVIFSLRKYFLQQSEQTLNKKFSATSFFTLLSLKFCYVFHGVNLDFQKC